MGFLKRVYLWLIILQIFKCDYEQVMFTQAYTPQKTIELAVFIDQYLYHYWFSLLKRSSSASTLSSPPPTSTLSMHRFIRSYLDVLLESLNLIYAHPSLASFSSSPLQEVPLIGFHLAHTEIFWRRREPTRKSYSTAAPNYLETFCDFAKKENWNGNRWDHALLLTGVDLKFPNGTNYSVAGISWDNSMCNKTYSCSVVEGKTFRSVMTAVHEIGHSLGMEHDGRKYNFKCPPTGYIMSHAGGGDDPVGKIAWSPCSKYNLKAFFAAAPSVLSNQAACLDNKPPEMVRREKLLTSQNNMKQARYVFADHGYNSRDRYRKKLVEVSGILPGGRFSVAEQCRLGGGAKWRPSGRRAHVRKLCLMLYCNNTLTGELVPFHPALEGTPCGRNRVCKYGECLPVQITLLKQQ